MIRKALTLLIILVALLSAACSQQTATTSEKKEQPKVLRVGLIPNQAPEKIKAKYEPFRKYLEEKLGMPVELFVATNYAGVVEAMAADKLDMAYFGGLTYVQAKQKAKIHPIVTEIDSETKTTKYYSLIITPANSPIKTLQDLKGKTFAFGDINSTSGSLYPRIMLDRAWLKVPDDFANIIYTGKHDATALAVQNGKVDAGGLEGRILNKLIEDGKIDKNKIRILAKSDPIEGYPWCVQDSMDPQLEAKIVDAFLSIKDPELLKLLRAEGFARVKAEDYAYVEQEARRLGLLKQ
ncbi:phosphonate transport system substrate-binding protein [Carboxydocella sporoproducens DSM 16521]|uniref:Phosphonate transport system substrate-binding protein n=2 Tax=Carboxydocella TaxID=178898 RepID=A0A1T4Q1I2_9FIRM|nr:MULTISPECIES: phosphate/phosphite/phosphonate ABC transporter substrate-binding protein [Carboxydocella]AVX21227.1 phosphonate transport system substrate-binding protein [Carboxydocella thermautotrophica]SJZ97397.1 phosphonate transport system substrate-binding protein [Carboxydocella sporoproducens DSM 16521]